METLQNVEVSHLNKTAYPESVNETKSVINIQALLWTLVAVVLYVIYSQQPDKGSMLCVVQLMLVAIFLLLAVIKFFMGNRKLIYTPTGSVVLRKERYYSLALESDIRQCLREANIARLNALRTDDAGGIMVETMQSEDKVFMAMRMQKFYLEGYRPETEWKVVSLTGN